MNCGNCDQPIRRTDALPNPIDDIAQHLAAIRATGEDSAAYVHTATGEAPCAGLVATPETPARYVAAIEASWRVNARLEARVRELEANPS